MLRNLIISFILSGFIFSDIKSQLRADFSASVNSGCLPLAVSLTDKSDGNPDKWVWEVGDGRVFVVQNPGLVYLNPGSYTIKLTIFKGNDQTATVTKTSFINVYDFPKVNFDASPTEGCSPLNVRFRNLSTSGSGTISSQKWDFGDGNSGTTANPTHLYKNTGLYSVTLTVENSFKCQSSFSIPSLIRVFDTVNAEFGFTISPSCEPPFLVKFEDQSAGIGLADQKWDFGDGAKATDRNPEHTYNNSGSFIVTLIKFNNRGCSDTIRKTIKIQTATISVGFDAPNSFCRGPLVAFKNTSNPLNQIDSVFWDFGDGSTSKQISPSKGFAFPGDYNVKLTAYFGTCQKTTSKIIKILPGPKTSFSGGPVLESCKPPLKVTFQNETPDGKAHEWRFGNANRPGGETRDFTFDKEGTYSVRLITSNAAGCFDTLVKPNYVKIVPLTITSVPGLPFEGCFPYTKTLRPKVESVSPIVKWEWDFGDGRTSDEENPTITYNQRGTYEVKLRVTNQEGCVDDTSFSVKGGFKPQVDFSADPLLVCTSGEVSFKGKVNGNYTGLFWIFGDGKSAVDILNPINAYKDTGFMNVTFYASDFGCVDSLEKKQYLYVSPPFANFNIISNCNNRYQREFRDSSFGGDQWLWDFGDGKTSTQKNPVHIYDVPGEYRVKLTVSSGVCLHEKVENVLILDDLPDFEITSIANCTSNTLKFEAKSPSLNIDNIKEFSWRFSDDVIFRNAAPIITRTFIDFQQLSLRLSIVDSNGCSRSITKPVPIVLGGPKARIIPDSIVACAGSAILFPDSSFRNPNSEIIKWTWNFGNGADTVYTKPGFQNIYDRPGVYDLRLKVEDKNGCIDSIILPRSVQVFEPKADFWFRDTVICPNTPLEIFNDSYGIGLTYLWSFGDGSTSTEKIPAKVYQGNGVFDVSLKITDTANCISLLSKPAYMNVGGIKAEFNVSDSFAACPPLLVSFSNNSKGAVSYKWDFGNGNTSILPSPVQTYTALGEYFARLVATGKGGCSDTALQRILIKGPTGDIQYAPLTGCPPLKVSFSSNTKNVKTYIWDFSDGTTIFSPDSAVAHTYLNPGTYRPRVIFEDGDNCRISIVGKEEIKVVGVRSLIKELPTYVFCDTALVAFQDSSLTNDKIKLWRWDFGDGNTSNVQNPTHIYKKPGRYRASLFVETFDQCSNLYFLPSEIIVAPSPDFKIQSDSSGCLPVEIKFTVSKQKPDTTSLTWQWDFGNGTFSNLENPAKVIYQNPGRFSVKATITDNYGCTQILGREINAYAVPQVSINIPTQTVFCDSGSIQFLPTINTIDPIKEYRWDFGNGITSNEQSPLMVYKIPGRYNVSLEVETGNACSNKYKLPNEIVVAQSPDFAIFSDSVGCLPVEIKFTTSKQKPDTTSLTWRWDFGNGTFSNLENPAKVTYQNPGRFSVKATITDNYGCTQILGREINAYAVPQVSINIPTQTVFCDSGRIQFLPTINTIDPIKEYRWDFGNGITSNEQSPLMVYKIPGRYNVSLEVETGNACSNKYKLPNEIVVAQSPDFAIFSDSVGCLPVEIKFTTSKQKPDTTSLTWQWDFGNGTFSNLENPAKVTYQNPGRFSVKATITDNYGCTQILGREINAYAVPQVSINIPTQTVFCDSGRIQFLPTINTIDPIKEYRWDFGNGITSNEQSPLMVYNNPGRNNVSLEVKTVNGCSKTHKAQFPIIISKSPRISMLKDSAFCTPNRVFIKAEWLNPDTSKLAWVWNFGGNPDAAGINNGVPVPGLVWFRIPGKYTVRGTVKNEYGCSTTASRVLTVVDTPKLKITSPPFICLGEAVPLLVTGAERYQWSPSAGLSCSDCSNPVASPTANVKYNVKGINQDGATCEREVGVSIQVIQPFKLTVSRGDTLCVGESYQIKASGAQQYLWAPSNGLSATNIPNPIAKPEVTTNYVLIASDNFNCFKETVTVPVVVYPKPLVEILERTYSGNIGSRFTVQTNFSNVTRWRWTPSTGLSCFNCPNPEVSVMQNSMKYRVSVTNPGGCEASDEFSVEPICNSELVFIPNTFSPNADGRNDIFYPMSNIPLIVSSIRVFNRWGQLVYERKNFSTNDQSAGWNGTFQGTKLPPDVFVYIAELPCSGNQKIELRGNITLLR